MVSSRELPRLIAVFFADFHPLIGPEIVCQVPESAIATALSTFPTRAPAPDAVSDEAKTPVINVADSTGMVKSTSDAQAGAELGATRVLANFSDLLQFVIPQPSLCGHLITKATRTAKICGCPVRIEDQVKYSRNEFIFNLCFVFERDAELSGFEPLIRKTGRVLRSLEESSSLLSSPPPGFRIADLLEQLYLDINAYSETSIQLPNADLDLVLFPFRANPPEINNWDVPIPVAALEEMKNGSWDMTLFKVCSFINGVNSVKRIAELAEVDLGLARSCVQHLLYYSAIILVDLFRYSNCYTVRPGIADTAQFGEEEDEGVTDLREECEAYVFSGGAEAEPVPFATLLRLYSLLRSGLSISDWIDSNAVDSLPIDVRRMIQFGVIKGFLRRVYAYPVWLNHPMLIASRTSASIEQTRFTSGTGPSTTADAASTLLRPDLDRNSSSVSSAVSSSTSVSYPSTQHSASLHKELSAPSAQQPTPAQSPYPSSLPLLLDGSHHTDELCIRYGIGLKHLEKVLKAIGGAADDDTPGYFGDVSLLYI